MRVERLLPAAGGTPGASLRPLGQVVRHRRRRRRGNQLLRSRARFTSRPSAIRDSSHGLIRAAPRIAAWKSSAAGNCPTTGKATCITNDFRAHRVCRYVVTPKTARAIRRKQMPELIKTNHPAFRPIDVKLGPDGALYIADWYNPIIQHGEVDFRDPRRDLTHGRIWRVTAKGRPLVRPKSGRRRDEDLLNALTAPETWTRRTGPARDARTRSGEGRAGVDGMDRTTGEPHAGKRIHPPGRIVDISSLKCR